MKLGEKILKLRKEHGLSQEEFVDKVGVTRQTISNWELAETSPNPEQLKLISKEFCVSIDELLDNDIQNVLVKKVSSTDDNVKRILKFIKIFIIIIVLVFLALLLRKMIVSRNDSRRIEESIYCKIYGEEHGLNIIYEELTGQPLELGGDSYFLDILDLNKYNDANQIFNVINDYSKKNGGSCKRILGHNLNDLVNISIKEGSLSNNSVTLIISENDDYNISYGDYFQLEKYNYKTNVYEKIKEIEDNNCGFNDMAYIITREKPLELVQDWSCMYGSLDKGLYLLTKEVSFESDNPISQGDIFYISLEFEIK